MARPKIEDLTQWQSQTPEDVWAELMRARREAEALRAALKPFAAIASVHVRDAEALGWADDYVTLRAVDLHNPLKDAALTVGDCRTALVALKALE